MTETPTPQRRKKNSWTRPLVIGVLAVFLVSGLAPLATAEKDRRPERPEAAESKRVGRDAFGLRINATAVDKDNNTYTIQLGGIGLAKYKVVDGNLTAVKGRAKVHVRVLDANGTEIKNGTIGIKFQARQTESGEWKWHLETVGKTRKGVPRLEMRGPAEKLDDPALHLEGKGHAVFKKDDAERRTPVRITSVDGVVRRA